MTASIGIDPSLTATAICVLHDGDEPSGYVHSAGSSESGLIQRLNRYQDLVDRIVRDVINQPYESGLVCLEGYSFASKGRAVVSLGEFGILLRSALLETRFDLVEVPPTLVKKFATGKGNASKTLVATSLTSRYGFAFASDDAADAFCLAKIAECLNGGVPETAFQVEVVEKLREAR